MKSHQTLCRTRRKKEEKFHNRDNFMKHEIDPCVSVVQPDFSSKESSYDEDSDADLSDTDPGTLTFKFRLSCVGLNILIILIYR